ncbi:DUF4097 family beta strand repeat-containing protein [Streptomyces sp. CC224B]|uniref:DUF4097 family beta strand repeat-containing protein n=1 Tax=Streptomyces sp. CC224B TaxID=3044571 RepID=UPI0024A8BBEE|nr:DUF4097 family beta strand repeat-containing protein [Streptomyces sp. CC224B]
MPAFDTPESVSALVEFEVGTAHFVASKRLDTVVTVEPSDPGAQADVKVAEQVQVTCTDGRLVVRGPKQRSMFGKNGSVTITVELPAGADVQGVTAAGGFQAEGRLGTCRFETSAGDILLAETGAAVLKSGYGTIRLERADGDVEVETAGPVDLGEINGTLRADSQEGDIRVAVAHAGVEAKAGKGAVRLADVARGRVSVESSAGDLEVGVRESSAVRLEVNTQYGTVHNALDQVGAPVAHTETVELQARTGYGDIVIRRA